MTLPPPPNAHALAVLILAAAALVLFTREKILEGTLYADNAMALPIDDEHPLKDEDQQIAEVVVIEGSHLVGRTISGIPFADRYGMMTLAIHRAGRHPKKVYDEIGDIRLKAGDILLVQGPREQIAGLKKEKDFLVLDATADLPYSRKAPVALLIMLGIVVSAALGGICPLPSARHSGRC